MTGRKPTRARALGVSDDDYAARLEAQHGHCALCPNRPLESHAARVWRCRYCKSTNAALAPACFGCGLARPKPPRLHVDHDHETGAIRGLLCHSCNRRLWPGVTADWLIRAALYIDPEQADVIARGRAVAYAMAPETP